ncbi:MarR family transcriptional regulator [Pseudonocardia yuanmonensis]|uniref:MarR family transcriptional regulator n=1 Tax=Pseudonocardia yuanmonensis TaxID=1095914 RepID=UPI0031E68CCD
MRRLQRAQEELTRALTARLGLRALDFTAMTHLMAADAPLGPGELASLLGISSGSGTELADRLERAGHLHRRRAAEDRRRIVLEPDEASVSGILGQLAPLFGKLDQLADSFTSAEQAVITRYLTAATELVHGHALDLAAGS